MYWGENVDGLYLGGCCDSKCPSLSRDLCSLFQNQHLSRLILESLYLSGSLNTRWKSSVADTNRDHGANLSEGNKNNTPL